MNAHRRARMYCGMLAAFASVVMLAASHSSAQQDPIGAIESAFAAGDVAPVRDRYDAMHDSRGDVDHYLRAYAGWRLVQMTPALPKKDKKKILKAARRDLDALLKNDPKNAEALALRGGVNGELITGAISGMTLGPKVSRDLDAALELAPENPRVALMRGVNFHFTPSAFGGGDDKAEAELRRARALFHRTADDSWPGWGQVDALGWLGQILAAQERIEEAIELFDEALMLRSDHHWIMQLKSAVAVR